MQESEMTERLMPKSWNPSKKTVHVTEDMGYLLRLISEQEGKKLYVVTSEYLKAGIEHIRGKTMEQVYMEALNELRER